MTFDPSRESKRKTAAVVALRNDERLFGDAALNTVRFDRGKKENGEREGGRARERERERVRRREEGRRERRKKRKRERKSKRGRKGAERKSKRGRKGGRGGERGVWSCGINLADYHIECVKMW